MSELYNEPPDDFEDIMPPREPVPPPDQTEVNQPGTVWPPPPYGPAVMQETIQTWQEITGQRLEPQAAPPVGQFQTLTGEPPRTVDPNATQRYVERATLSDGMLLDEALRQASQLRAAQASPKPLIEVMIPKEIITMLKAMPENATYRTMALAILKIPIPDDCKTYQDISDWVEQQFKPKDGTPIPTEGITIRVHREETEYGMCRYSESRSGSADWKMSLVRLLELAESAEDANELINSIQEEAIENSPNIETESDGEVEYDGYNETNTELDGESINRSGAYNEIVRALKIHAPHILEQLAME